MPLHARSLHLEQFDPLRLWLGLGATGPGFLESPAPVGRISRFSIVPLRGQESYRLDADGLVRLHRGTLEALPGDPFERLEATLAERRCPVSDATPFPGGLFGYCGYDLAGWIEQLPRRARRDRPVPDLWLTWVDATAVYDHHHRRLTLAGLDPALDLADLEQQVLAALQTPLPPPPAPVTELPRPVFSQAEFEARVDRARSYIAAGDIYQANLSCRFDGHYAGSAAALYARLRAVNPSPFACLLCSPGLEIISSSPERLVSLRRGIAETRPIAGTRPRGYSPPEDQQLGEELLAHPKERAEHVMLLDLERNDLGKVCQPGSVKVDEMMVLERYSHVTHIVSNVRGRLRDGLGPLALLRATFPGGTITGVPKKRCMEIIDELEPVGRGS